MIYNKNLCHLNSSQYVHVDLRVHLDSCCFLKKPVTKRRLTLLSTYRNLLLTVENLTAPLQRALRRVSKKATAKM